MLPVARSEYADWDGTPYFETFCFLNKITAYSIKDPGKIYYCRLLRGNDRSNIVSKKWQYVNIFSNVKYPIKLKKLTISHVNLAIKTIFQQFRYPNRH